MKDKRIVIAAVAALIVVAAAATYFLVIKPKAEFAAFNAVETVARPDLGLAFSYTAGPDALSMVEAPVSGEPLKGAFILMPSSRYVEFHNNQGGDVGPTISLFVFSQPTMSSKNAEALSRRDELLLWAENNQGLTSYNNLQGEVTDVSIDGLKGVTYVAQATYQQQVYLFLYQDHIYMFVGQYSDTSDYTYKVYKDVIESVQFD